VAAVYADETAYVEDECVDPRGTGGDRIAFCVAYDLADGVITSARCYGALGFLAPSVGRPDRRLSSHCSWEVAPFTAEEWSRLL
jgi:hypothetical protein